MTKRQDFKHMKSAITRMEKGTALGGHRQKGDLPLNLKVFGCQRCSWIGSNLCPNGIKIGEHHSNWICIERMAYIKNELQTVGSMPRVIQNEMAIQLKMMNDKMAWEYAETGELSEHFRHINKNLISLIDKMRRQDEGIKIQEDLNITHEDFRKIVDIEVERIEKSNNGTRQIESGEEVSDNKQKSP